MEDLCIASLPLQPAVPLKLGLWESVDSLGTAWMWVEVCNEKLPKIALLLSGG